MSSLNKVILIGTVRDDPQATGSKGVHISSFVLGTRATDKPIVNENIDWHHVSLFRGLADVGMKILKKGDIVYIEGKIKPWSLDQAVETFPYTVVAEVLNLISGSRNQQR